MPNYIYSDQGKNFVGCKNELTKLFARLDKHKIMTEGVKNHIEWDFSAAKSANQNGLSEILVKSTKRLIYRVFKNCHQDYQGFQTMLTQVEMVINNRPLAVIKEADDYVPITPAQLCIGRRMDLLPDPPKPNSKTPLITKLFAERQALLKRFWQRWQAQYLLDLQVTRKWQTDKGVEVKKGDLLLMHEENLKKNSFVFGAVLEVHRSRADGKVRSCLLQTKTGKVTRPINKLSFFESFEPSFRSRQEKDEEEKGLDANLNTAIVNANLLLANARNADGARVRTLLCLRKFTKPAD